MRSLLAGLLFAGSLVASNVSAITPTPTPTPSTNQTPGIFNVVCSLTYIWNGGSYKTKVNRTCSAIVTLHARSGQKYKYPAACTILANASNCVVQVNPASPPHPFPPYEVFSHASVITRAFDTRVEETSGCIYNFMNPSVVTDYQGRFIGANVDHNLICAKPLTTLAP
jgi:hypothetical protein